MIAVELERRKRQADANGLTMLAHLPEMAVVEVRERQN